MTFQIAGVQLTITMAVRPLDGDQAERERQWQSLVTELDNRRWEALCEASRGCAKIV